MSNKIFDTLIVFYVEDDEDDQLIFRKTLAEIAPNVQLVIFNNGDELMLAINDRPPLPAIVFVDLNMPGINGFGIIKILKSNPVFSHLPLIVFSTSDSKKSFEESRKNGADFYIVKPKSITHLKQSLYKALSTNWGIVKLSKDNFVYQHQ